MSCQSRACYIGVYGNLEKVSTQNQVADLVNQVMQKLTMTRSVSDRELGEVHLFCHVHMSLLSMHRWISVAELFRGKHIPEHEKKLFRTFVSL